MPSRALMAFPSLDLFFSLLNTPMPCAGPAPNNKLPKKERSRILLELSIYPTLIQDREGVWEVEIPSSFPYFFLDLALYSDSLGC